MDKKPESKIPDDLRRVRRSMDETWDGTRPVDPKTYPYFNPPYDYPFPHIGTVKQLFLDNYMLAHLSDTKREIVKPEKANPALIRFENLPWERYHNTMTPLAALQDPDSGRYQLWYKTLLSGNTNSGGSDVAMCYAESEDGLNWTKPRLPDSVPFGGVERTNIVMTDFDNGTVVLNHDTSDPKLKYLAVGNPGKTAFERGHRTMSRAYASPDGIHWDVISDDNPFRHHHQMRVIRDETIGKWIGYSQWSHAWGHDHVRRIGRQLSDDFIRWSPKEVVLSGQWDPNLPPNVELHTMSVRKAGDLYIGIVEEAHGEFQWLHNKNGSNQHDQFHTKAALYCSRDGAHFTRADNYQPWGDNDPPGGQYYGYFAHSVAGALVANGKMIIPCSAYPHKQRDTRPTGTFAHAPEGSGRASQNHIEELKSFGVGNPMMHEIDPEMEIHKAVGAMVLREDGWAAIKPTYERGDAYTTQFLFEGDKLRVNALCDYGFIKVEILDPELKPYPGFSLDESTPIHGPSTRIWHDVRWTGGKSLSSLWNKPIRLRFHLLESSLYAFQFAE